MNDNKNFQGSIVEYEKWKKEQEKKVIKKTKGIANGKSTRKPRTSE